MDLDCRLEFDFIDATVYKITYCYAWRERTPENTSVTFAGYKKTDEKFHYEFYYPFNGKSTEALDYGLREDDIISIEPVTGTEFVKWSNAAFEFEKSLRSSKGYFPDIQIATFVPYEGKKFINYLKRPSYYRVAPLDYKKVYDNIISATTAYLKKFGIKSMVLGVSGGIDSTVAAALCKTVSDKTGIPLILVSLPCKTNEMDEQTAASKTGKEFGTEFYEDNIQDLFEFTHARFNKFSKWEPTRISQGNVKARIRNNYLRNIAGVTGGIVIDTDQITEHMLGFFTVAGDVGDFDIISGLYKHEVYKLADWLIENVYPTSEALRLSVKLVPTDGNGVAAGGDLAQIAPGSTYDAVDDILMRYMYVKDNHQNTDKVVSRLSELYGEDTVKRVIRRHEASEFKRWHSPIAIDIFSGKVVQNNGTHLTIEI